MAMKAPRWLIWVLLSVAVVTAVLAGVMAGEFDDLAANLEFLWELGPG